MEHEYRRHRIRTVIMIVAGPSTVASSIGHGNAECPTSPAPQRLPGHPDTPCSIYQHGNEGSSQTYDEYECLSYGIVGIDSDRWVNSDRRSYDSIYIWAVIGRTALRPYDARLTGNQCSDDRMFVIRMMVHDITEDIGPVLGMDDDLTGSSAPYGTVVLHFGILRSNRAAPQIVQSVYWMQCDCHNEAYHRQEKERTYPDDKVLSATMSADEGRTPIVH